MDSMDLLRKEQKVTLIFQKDNSMIEMVCSIENIYDDRLELNLPQYFMRYINYLQVGKRVTAKVFSKVGTIDFNTVIISSPLEEEFLIEFDYNAIKITPGAELPVVQAIEALELVSEEGAIVTKTFEISSDYIKFYSDKKFNLEDNLTGTLRLSKNYGKITFSGIITDHDAVYDNEYTLHFSTITEVDKQILLYYMYMYTKDSD